MFSTTQLETASEVERVVLQHTPADGFVEEMVPRHEQIGDQFGEEVTDGHTRLTMLKLAGLLHDIAKPATRTVESSGRIRFLGHHSEGAEVAQRILKRLRISGRGVELARLLVQNHLRPGQMAQQGELPTGKAVFRYFRDLGDAAIDTLYLNMADYLAARGPKLSRREWSKYCLIIGHNSARRSRTEGPSIASKADRWLRYNEYLPPEPRARGWAALGSCYRRGGRRGHNHKGRGADVG